MGVLRSSGLRSAGKGEVVHVGDAAGGPVDTVALEAAVAEDLPVLHAREDVLDACPHPAVRCVVFLFPLRQPFLPGLRLAGARVSSGPCRWMIRPTVAVEIPNSGASCGMDRFVRQYIATSSTQSSRDSDHGRPGRPGSRACPPARWTALTSR